MFSTDRISADLRMEEYKKIADSYSLLADKKEVAKEKKSIFAKVFNF